MFTGIIEEIGSVEKCMSGNEGSKLFVRGKKILQGTKVGDSIAVNGVCLTVASLTDSNFCADVMKETLRCSNLGNLKNGDSVNLERAMSAEGRFGGHIVSGHIDGTGTIIKFEKEANATWVYIKAGEEILSLVVHKGSIAIDGISLTVSKTGEDFFAVSIIPHTANETTLLSKKIGDKVNLENDIVGKYVQKLLDCEKNNQSGRDSKIMQWLSE